MRLLRNWLYINAAYSGTKLRTMMKDKGLGEEFYINTISGDIERIFCAGFNGHLEAAYDAAHRILQFAVMTRIARAPRRPVIRT